MILQTDPFAAFPPRRQAVLAIAGATVLALVVLAHHPVAVRGSSEQQLLTDIVAQQRMDGIVHGVFILLLAIMAGGLSALSARLGWSRPAVIVATLAYGLGCCAVSAAALLDGFLTPQLAQHFLAATPAVLQAAHIVLLLVSVAIQVLTKAGLVSMSVGLLAWSFALWRAPRGGWSRWFAVPALAAGVMMIVLLAGADLWLGPANIGAVFAILASWNIVVVAMLWRKEP